MTFSYVLSTEIGKVRLKISDTNVATAHFTDEELQVFLNEAGNSDYLAAALALEAWAAALTDNAESERIGDYSYSKKSADNKLKLAERYRQHDATTPALTWAEMTLVDEEEE